MVAPQTARQYDRFTFENRINAHEDFSADASNVAAMVELALMLAPMQLSKGDEQGFNASMGLLIHHGSMSAPLLARNLSAEDPTSRRFAAHALALLDSEHVGCAVESLQRALDDEDQPTRSLAAQALSALPPSTLPVVDSLISDWRDGGFGDVWQIAMQLAEEGSMDSITALAEVFPHGARDSQMAAATALATLGDRARIALQALLAARSGADAVLLSTIDAAIEQISPGQ